MPFHQRTISAVWSFIKVLICMNTEDPEWLLTRAKQKGKSPVGYSQKWSLSHTGEVAYESFSVQSFKSQFKRGFTKLVLIRADRLRSGSQGELQLYYLSGLSRVHFSRQAFLEVAVRHRVKSQSTL